MHNGFVVFLCLLFWSEGLGCAPRDPGRVEDLGELISFQLFTTRNSDSLEGEVLTLGDKGKLLQSHYNGSLPTILSTHGFLDKGNVSWMFNLRRNILMEVDANFIAVDYSPISKNLLYNEVVEATKKVGNYIGQFLKFLQAEGNLKLEKTHLIGHSLGAQVMGFAAGAFPARTIGRVTGLDPAAPLFENKPEAERLNPKVAKLVDVIHTCVALYGMKKQVGTVDFYPNGGFNQPGCGTLSCHHARSREYFYKSLLNPNQYIASKCKTLKNALEGSCKGEPARMGYFINYSSPGIYYLKIN